MSVSTGITINTVLELERGHMRSAISDVARHAILQKASDQNCRVWIESEQQYVQHSIDRWTINMMRQWNLSGKAVVYITNWA